jgi:N utilization substance protein B
MSSQFNLRRESRAAALQFLYAWSMNKPANLTEDVRVFFEGQEKPRDQYAFAEELIDGVLKNVDEIDG